MLSRESEWQIDTTHWVTTDIRDWKASEASHRPALYIVQLNKTFAAHQLAWNECMRIIPKHTHTQHQINQKSQHLKVKQIYKQKCTTQLSICLQLFNIKSTVLFDFWTLSYTNAIKMTMDSHTVKSRVLGKTWRRRRFCIDTEVRCVGAHPRF